MFGGSEININFPKNIWVHLTYQTAFVDEDGKLQFREDVYGRDAKMIAILKGSERKVADIAIERAPNTSSKPVRMPVGMYGGSTAATAAAATSSTSCSAASAPARSRSIGRAAASASKIMGVYVPLKVADFTTENAGETSPAFLRWAVR